MSESFTFQVGTQRYAYLHIPQSFIDREQEETAKKGIKRVAILVLDRSGSMYDDYEQARQALLETIQELEGANVTDIGVVIFEDESVSKSTLDCTKLWELKQWIRQQEVGGGTNIPNALKAVDQHMAKFTTEYPDSYIEFSVVFFTDGEDYSGEVVMDCKAIKKMNTLVTNSNGLLNFGMHCIGFRSNHDAALLGQMARLGTLDGTFQYVQSADDIRQALEVVLGFGARVIPVQITTGTNRQVTARGTSAVIIEIDESEANRPLVLQLVGTDLSLPVTPVSEPEEVSEGFVRGIIQASEVALREVLARCTSYKYELEDSDDSQVQAIHRSLLALLAKVFKRNPNISRALRRELMTALQQACALAHELGDILSKKRRDGHVTNDVIASWQASSYRSTVMKARDLRTLDKRFEKNVAKLEELEVQIEELAQALDVTTLEMEIPRDLLDSTICMLSRANMIEVMEEGDCICLCLDVRRSPAAIHDPSLLTINRVGPSFISAQSFMDILADQVKYPSYRDTFDDEEEDRAADVHGGFDRQREYAQVFPGLANEPVNAILPLFLNKKHWDFAFKRSKAVLSWVATLDVAGGSGSEPVVIPFLVLFQLIKQYTQTPSDNNRFLFKLVLETCMAIYKTAPFELPKKITEQFNDFMASPEKRTTDVITSMPVFLGQLLCAVVNGDIALDASQLSQLGPLVSEEQFRRIMETFWPAPIITEPKHVVELLDLDRARFYDDPVSQWSARQDELVRGQINQQIDSAAFGRAFAEGSASGPAIEASLGNFEVVFPDPEWSDLNSADAILDSLLQKAPRSADPVLRTFSAMVDLIEKKGNIEESNKNGNVSIFDSMTPICRLAFCLQSRLQSKNSLRRAAVTNGTFVPETYSNEEAAWKFIRTTVKDGLKKEVGKTVSGTTRKVQESMDRSMAKIFHETEDLNIAAGILRYYCKFRGSSHFPAFINVLQRPLPLEIRPDSPSDLAKLRMLVTGFHEGRPVFTDNLVLDCPIEDKPLPTRQHWRPTRANVYRFLNYFVGQSSASEEVLCELFPTFETYIRPRFHPRRLA